MSSVSGLAAQSPAAQHAHDVGGGIRLDPPIGSCQYTPGGTDEGSFTLGSKLTGARRELQSSCSSVSSEFPASEIPGAQWTFLLPVVAALNRVTLTTIGKCARVGVLVSMPNVCMVSVYYETCQSSMSHMDHFALPDDKPPSTFDIGYCRPENVTSAGCDWWNSVTPSGLNFATATTDFTAAFDTITAANLKLTITAANGDVLLAFPPVRLSRDRSGVGRGTSREGRGWRV